MSSAKKLCKWKKQEYKDHFAKLIKITQKPNYLCENCGRVAKKGKWLCDARSVG